MQLGLRISRKGVSFFLPHGPVALVPSVLSDPGSISIAAAGALALLFVIGVPSTSPTSDVG